MYSEISKRYSVKIRFIFFLVLVAFTASHTEGGFAQASSDRWWAEVAAHTRALRHKEALTALAPHMEAGDFATETRVVSALRESPAFLDWIFTDYSERGISFMMCEIGNSRGYEMLDEFAERFGSELPNEQLTELKGRLTKYAGVPSLSDCALNISTYRQAGDSASIDLRLAAIRAVFRKRIFTEQASASAAQQESIRMAQGVLTENLRRAERAPLLIASSSNDWLCATYGTLFQGYYVKEFQGFERAFEEVKAEMKRRRLVVSDVVVKRKSSGIGSNRCTLIAVIGEPRDENQLETSTGVHTQLVYGQGNYFYLRNNIVTAIQR